MSNSIVDAQTTTFTGSSFTDGSLSALDLEDVNTASAGSQLSVKSILSKTDTTASENSNHHNLEAESFAGSRPVSGASTQSQSNLVASRQSSATARSPSTFISDDGDGVREESEWIRNQKRMLEQKLLALQKLKKKRKNDKKAAAMKLERTLPMDLLAKDWFSDNPLTCELRVYLIDKLLPTLILGLEKVLVEADKRGLIYGPASDDDETVRRFSATTLLAQYLMRNNPAYANFAEASPYARGLKDVADTLRRDVYELEANKLAKLKIDAQKQRELMEIAELQRVRNVKKRAVLLKNQFSLWLVDESGRLQLQLIQNALYSYQEISTHLASDEEKAVKYSKELDATDETGITLSELGFVEYVEDFVKEMPMPDFEDLLRHLDQCAMAFRKTFEKEVWRKMFVQLFESLDMEEMGYLDRHRVLHLLEKFWDKLASEIKDSLNNPRKWPVIELEELDDLYPDSDADSDSDGRDESVLVSTETAEGSTWASTAPVSGLTTSGGDVASRGEFEADKSIAEASVAEEQASPSSPAKEEEEETAAVDATEAEDATVPPADGEVAAAATTEESSGEDGKVEETADQQDATADAEADGDEKIAETEAPKSPPDAGAAADAEPVIDAASPDAAADDAKSQIGEVEGGGDGVGDASADAAVGDSSEVADAAAQEDGGGEVGAGEKPKGEEGEGIPTVVVDVQPSSDATSPVEEEARDVVEAAITSADETAVDTDQDREKLLGGKSVHLVTPAPSTDGSMDVGPVSIQFSKAKPSPAGRKTTSYTTVQKKKEASASAVTGGANRSGEMPGSEETIRAWGEDATISDVQPPAELPGPPHPGIASEHAARKEEIRDSEIEAGTVVTTLASDAVLVQHTADDMASNFQVQPVEVKTRPQTSGRMSVTFASEPVVLLERPTTEFFSEFSSRNQSRMTSAFDENQLNVGRFTSLMENFLSDDTGHVTVEDLVNFLHGGYVETEEEKLSRLARARKAALSAKHRQMIDNLFHKWDNDNKGSVDIDDVEEVLSKYKGGAEAGAALKRGRQSIRQARKNQPYHDRRRLTRAEFHVYINAVCEAMTGGEEVFDELVEYATTTVERSFAERVRGDARRKWLAQIMSAAHTGAASMDYVYRALFQTLHKDAEAHGGQKKVSAYIGLLEHNLTVPHRGPILLRYVACTPDNAQYMLGKAFYEDMKGISFYSIKRGKLVHVPRVQSHGRIHFWNWDRDDQTREGSLVLVPLRDAKRRTYGLLGVDNVDDSTNTDRSVFSSHEINFYQGISKTFSTAFHHVDLRRKLLRIVDAAMSWIHSRAPHVHAIVVYFVEPDPKALHTGCVLRKMITADNNRGVTTHHHRPSRLYRKDNLFRDYLFNCMENSETTSADAYGERHTAYPLRNDEGRCQCVVDISIGVLRHLPNHENKEVQRMLKLLQQANREVMRESKSGEKTVVLEAEGKGNDEARVGLLFDRLMLTDLRENVQKLDNNVFAELKDYKLPPQMIHNILKAVLLLFYRDPEKEKEFDDWITCKQMVTGKLKQQILSYDPTADHDNEENDESTENTVQAVGRLLKGVAHGAVSRHGSRPAQQLYNWAFVCLSLIEHTRKMRESDGQLAVTPVTSASTIATTLSGADTTDGAAA